MTTVEDVFYLPDQLSFEAMRNGGIGGALRAKKSGDHGTLAISPGALEFRGTKGTVTIAPIRGVSREGMTKIEYGEGADIRVAYFTPWVMVKAGFGKFTAFGKQKQLYETIEQNLGAVASASADRDLQQHRDSMRAGAARRAKVRMWIGGGVMVAGILITAITYSAAAGGGTYFVAYGAIIFGALAFFQGLAEWRKNRSG